MCRDFYGGTFELSIRHKNRNHLNLNSMKTLIFLIALALNFAVNAEVKAQHPVNNNIQFTVEANSEYPLLFWKNKKEMNTSYYLIECSNDYVNYKIINTVKAAGHSNFPTNYSFRHVSDSNANLSQAKYYRIVLVLMDGTRLYSEAKPCIPIDSSIQKNVIANVVE